MDFLVGTFNSPFVYTLRFDPPDKLQILHKSPAVGSHSWLALSRPKRNLYATAWLDDPSVVAYAVQPDHSVKLLNQKLVKSRSGYVAVSPTHLYSAGGSSGEAFRLNPNGSIGDLVQSLDFVDKTSSVDSDTSSDAHGGFGGLRNGAHSVDLHPDGRALYVADIGRNCVWTFAVDNNSALHLKDQHKHLSPRSNDGPRHTTPHPSGKYLYSVQEHSGMVDVFALDASGTRLEHIQGVRIMPPDKHESDFWADEVRVSASGSECPKFLYASTRGLKKNIKGYVAVFKLTKEGLIDGDAVDIFETPTCGGIANAVEPAPLETLSSANGPATTEYMALTDSSEGLVLILAFDGREIKEVARINLGEGEQCATAVWL